MDITAIPYVFDGSVVASVSVILVDDIHLEQSSDQLDEYFPILCPAEPVHVFCSFGDSSLVRFSFLKTDGTDLS